MVKLEPLTTTNFISIVQVIAVIAGFYFSWRSLNAAAENLRLATRSAQAQLFNQIAIQGRELQYKFMDTFLNENQSQSSLQQKQELFLGTVIGYYASCFE